MSIYIPFFYIIKHISTGRKYVGSKWAKSKSTNHLTFMTDGGYCTSSKDIKKIIEKEGLSSFEIECIATEEDLLIPFNNLTSVIEYETFYLRYYDCSGSPEFFNRHNNRGMAGNREKSIKAAKTKYRIINEEGLNVHQIAAAKGYQTLLLKENGQENLIENMLKTRNKIGEDGLNSFQRGGLKIKETRIKNGTTKMKRKYHYAIIDTDDNIIFITGEKEPLYEFTKRISLEAGHIKESIRDKKYIYDPSYKYHGNKLIRAPHLLNFKYLRAIIID